MKSRILIFIFSLVVGIVNAQPKGVWDYPVKPGTEEWKQFKSYAEKVAACQIPEELLSSLSTEDLTELCLRYPLYTDFLKLENISDGLDRLFSNFNGIRELYRREDVSSSLNRRYTEKIRSLSFLDGENSDFQKGLFIINVSILEVLFSRIELQNSEDKEAPKAVLQSLVAGWEEKMKYPKIFQGLFTTNYYARARIISKLDETFIERLPDKDENMVFITGMVDGQTFSLIHEMSFQLIE